MDEQGLAEKHWEYTKHLLELAGHKTTELEKFLYIQALIHGEKHGKDKDRL